MSENFSSMITINKSMSHKLICIFALLNYIKLFCIFVPIMRHVCSKYQQLAETIQSGRDMRFVDQIGLRSYPRKKKI
jgi:hypothetical protein